MNAASSWDPSIIISDDKVLIGANMATIVSFESFF